MLTGAYSGQRLALEWGLSCLARACSCPKTSPWDTDRGMPVKDRRGEKPLSLNMGSESSRVALSMSPVS